MPTQQQLRAELDSDPAGLGYAPLVAAGDDSGLADILNDPTAGRTALRPMRMSVFTQFLMSRSLLRKIRDAEANALLPAAVRDICYGLLLLIQGASDREVDPADAATGAMIDALVSAAVVSADDKAAWLTACTVPVSRAAELWPGSSVTHLDVAAARII